MKILESFLVAVAALRANPLRSFLTTLGIVIGVFIVITTVSMGEGAKNFIRDQFTSFGVGANTLAIYGAPETKNRGIGIMSSLAKSTITYRDIEALKSGVREATLVVPAIFGLGEFRYGKKQQDASFVIGTSEDYQKLVKGLVASGRFITAMDMAYHSKVAFIGQKLKEELFGSFAAEGEEIKINGTAFRVVGVMKKMSAVFGFDYNEMAIIPITTAEDVLKTSEITETWVSARGTHQVEAVAAEIKKILLRRHGKEDFQVRMATEMISRIDQIMGVLTTAIVAIAAISLIVGSVGIMNIMLVSVAERTREIGIRKAVGARQRDIFSQFLVEALLISVAGGVIGLLLGSGVLLLVGKAVNLILLPSLPASIAGFLVAAAVGVVSGIYPAMRAARLDPVEALRG